MPCTIVTGYSIDCRDSVGGLKNVYIADWSDVQTVTESSGVVTAVSMYPSKKFWTYNLEKENGSLTETEQNSVENGSVFWEQVVTFTIKKMTAAQRNNMKVLAQKRLMVIAQDMNGNYWLMGRHNGADKMGTNTATTGKAMGDLNGYTVTFTAKEQDCLHSIGSAIVATITV